MADFTLTEKARSDLKSIAAYTQRKWGKKQRNIYTLQFDETFHLLANTPKRGKECDFIKRGYRKSPVASHIVFYRNTSPSTIEIVRILHKRMDAEVQIKG